MIHELRIYHAMPGRLPDLNRRFETVTLKLWEKHGVRQLAFWTVLVGDSSNDLYYVLEWESLAERERIWNGFVTDPDWLAAKAQTERDGPLISHLSNLFLAPTAYSTLR